MVSYGKVLHAYIQQSAACSIIYITLLGRKGVIAIAVPLAIMALVVVAIVILIALEYKAASEIASQPEEIYVPYNSTIKYNIQTTFFQSATIKVKEKIKLKNAPLLLSLYAKGRKRPESIIHSFETAISNDFQIVRYWPQDAHHVKPNTSEPFKFKCCWQKINALPRNCQLQEKRDGGTINNIARDRSSDKDMIAFQFYVQSAISLTFTETLKMPPSYDVQLTEYIPSYTFQFDFLSEPMQLYATSQIQASEGETIEGFIELTVTYSPRQEIWVIGIITIAVLAAWVATVWCCRWKFRQAL